MFLLLPWLHAQSVNPQIIDITKVNVPEIPIIVIHCNVQVHACASNKYSRSNLNQLCIAGDIKIKSLSKTFSTGYFKSDGFCLLL